MSTPIDEHALVEWVDCHESTLTLEWLKHRREQRRSDIGFMHWCRLKFEEKMSAPSQPSPSLTPQPTEDSRK